MSVFGDRFTNFRSFISENASRMKEKVSGLSSAMNEKVAGLTSSKTVTENPNGTVTYNEVVYKPYPGGEFRDYPPGPDGGKYPEITYKMYFNRNNKITVRTDTNSIVENPPNHLGMKSGGRRRRRGTRKSKKSRKSRKSRRHKK
jgi:hypothetical protein